jgi:RNA polymerase sigma-70 factor (ECF subfamily)
MRLPLDSLTSQSHTLAQARSGSPEALGLLFTQHADAMFRVAIRLTGSAQDAEDVVQDVFVGLPEALRHYTEQGTFDAWLKRVTARYALMRLRAAARRPESSFDDTTSLAAPTHDVAERMTITDAIGRLSEPLRTVFVLHEIEGFSHVEIGHTLGIRAGTSEVRLFRARALLRASLKDDQ